MGELGAAADLDRVVDLDPVADLHEGIEKEIEPAQRPAQQRRAEPVDPDPETVDRERLEARLVKPPAVGGMILLPERPEFRKRPDPHVP